MNGFFVTGTDTDVGKTWVGCLLIKALIDKGIDLKVRKPIESGWPSNPNDIHTTDAWRLANAGAQLDQIDNVCPNHFSAALSPVRAARLENQALSLEHVATQCTQNTTPDSVLYVEGAGGFYSPLVEDGLNADLASTLQLPVILVANNRLGCMSHVLMTEALIKSRGLTLLAVVLNQVEDKHHDAAMNNQEDLQELLSQPVFSLGYKQTTLPEPLINLLY